MLVVKTKQSEATQQYTIESNIILKNTKQMPEQVTEIQPPPSPSPQQQKDEKSLIGEKEVLRVSSGEEEVNLDLDSYNFDAFISKMRDESCKPVLENIKRYLELTGLILIRLIFSGLLKCFWINWTGVELMRWLKRIDPFTLLLK